MPEVIQTSYYTSGVIKCLLALLVLLYDPQSALASDAYVLADNEMGQGFLRQRGTECFVITPAHVIEDALEIEITLKNRSSFDAVVLETFPVDIAVLKASGAGDNICTGSNWSDGSGLSRLLTVYEYGELRTMLADGSIRRTPVDIVSYDNYRSIRIRPRIKHDTLIKGFSGSPLYIADKPAGMLLSVQDDVGNVLRQDTLANYLALFFGDEVDTKAGSHEHIVNLMQPVSKRGNEHSQEEASALRTIQGSIAQGEATQYILLLQENSPILFQAPAAETGFSYRLELANNSDRRLLQKKISVNRSRGREFTFTPKESGEHTLTIVGQRESGRYELRLIPIALDKDLRGEANVIVPGDTISGSLAKDAIAEYRIMLQENSPLLFHIPERDGKLRYNIEILDPEGKQVFRGGRYSGQSIHRFPFTPKKNGVYTIRLVATDAYGRYEVRLKTLAYDSELRGEGNTVMIGNMIESEIAVGAYVEYRVLLELNSPIIFDIPGTTNDIRFNFEIIDPNQIRVFDEKGFNANLKYSFPFTPVETGMHILRFTGDRYFGRFQIRLSQYALDSNLRGPKNTAKPGDTLRGNLAANAVAEYILHLNGGSPIEFVVSKTGEELRFNVELYDPRGLQVLKEHKLSGSSAYRYRYTPTTTGSHKLLLIGNKNIGRYEIKLVNFGS